MAATAITAFHPVRVSGHAIRLHTMVCHWFNADFDGDRVAVYLPVTETGQQDARDRLSLMAHLERDPALLDGLLPACEAMWGLAWHALRPDGLAEICKLIGTELHTPSGCLSRTTLAAGCRQVLARDGVAAAVAVVEKLWRLGFAAAKASGASLSPLAGQTQQTPPAASATDTEADGEALVARLAARTDFTATDLGLQILAVRSGSRGNFDQLALLVGGGRTITAPDGTLVPILHGYQTGLTFTEWSAMAAVTWRRFVELVENLDRMALAAREQSEASDNFGVFARARRAAHPGVVFARAAANREVDQLADIDSRLFVGLPVE
jgi:hypothetical protein